MMSEDAKNLPVSQLSACTRLQQMCVSLGLLLLLMLSIITSPILALLSFSANQPVQNTTRTENIDSTVQSHDTQMFLAVSRGLEPSRLAL